jgi:anti-anti-sigma factor
MQVDFEVHETVIVAHLRGRLDTATAPGAEKALLAEIGKSSHHLVVNLDGTEYVSSSGLRILLRAAKQMESRGSAFALTEANPQVLEVLEVSGFLTIMRHFPSAAGAIDYVAEAARSSGG